MADVLLLFLAALLAIGGGLAVTIIARAGRRKRALEARDRPRRLRQELNQIDQYIRQLDQAAADDDIDRLGRERNREWDGLSSR
jgi:hypothetical protein